MSGSATRKPPGMTWRERLRSSVLLPAALMVILTLILVPPVGDFPLNDDWSYAGNVRELVENHQYTSTNRTLALLHTAWGALFTLPFGISYTALRLSTLTTGGATEWLPEKVSDEDYGK